MKLALLSVVCYGILTLGCVNHGFNHKEYNENGQLVSETNLFDSNLARNSRTMHLKGKHAAFVVNPIEVKCSENKNVKPDVVYQIKAKGDFIYMSDDREISVNLKELGQAGMSMYLQSQVIGGAAEGAGTLWDWLNSLFNK